MPGDYWQKFANYRALMGLFYTHPGKTLMFMGGEFAQMHEWKDYTELDWNLLDYPLHHSAQRFNRDMNFVVKHHLALYEMDCQKEGFSWIDADNSDLSIYSFIRYAKDVKDFVIVVLNMTPIVHHNFRIGVPEKGTYVEVINSDKSVYGGSNLFNGAPMETSDVPYNNFEQSLEMVLSPLSVTIIKIGD